MTAYRVEAVISEDGKIALDAEPFRPGRQVAVHVTDQEGPVPREEYPLRGSIVRYDQPFVSVAERDREVRQ